MLGSTGRVGKDSSFILSKVVFIFVDIQYEVVVNIDHTANDFLCNNNMIELLNFERFAGVGIGWKMDEGTWASDSLILMQHSRVSSFHDSAGFRAVYALTLFCQNNNCKIRIK